MADYADLFLTNLRMNVCCGVRVCFKRHNYGITESMLHPGPDYPKEAFSTALGIFGTHAHGQL